MNSHAERLTRGWSVAVLNRWNIVRAEASPCPEANFPESPTPRPAAPFSLSSLRCLRVPICPHTYPMYLCALRRFDNWQYEWIHVPHRNASPVRCFAPLLCSKYCPLTERIIESVYLWTQRVSPHERSQRITHTHRATYRASAPGHSVIRADLTHNCIVCHCSLIRMCMGSFLTTTIR